MVASLGTFNIIVDLLMKHSSFTPGLKIRVQATDTIARLKQLVQEHDGTPPPRQRLLFKGKPLEDHYTLRRKSIIVHAQICMLNTVYDRVRY
jgi:hypothetical protein